jgi:hypothetical protein
MSIPRTVRRSIGALLCAALAAGSVPASAAPCAKHVAPTITAQPAPQSVVVGAKATFSVAATGTAPLIHLWTRNGRLLLGVFASSYTTPATALADDGTVFAVTVCNLFGCVTSQPAKLSVRPPPTPPAITAQPQAQTVTEGETATFAATASGTAPLAYQWTRNGAPIAGATASSYTTPPAALGDDGAAFAVTVTNVAGAATSAAATLTVKPAPKPPAITSPPQAQSVTEGQTATFAVAATGTEPLSYQWNRSGSPIAGATAASYTTPATTMADDGASFTVTVTNAVASVTSDPAVLRVASKIQTVYIYEAGRLADGWSPGGWSNCASPNPAASYAGVTSLSFDLSCSSGWDAGTLGHWNGTFDLSPYDTLSFDIASDDPIAMANLYVWFDGAKNTVPVGPIQPGQFTHVVISLGDLGLPGPFINQFGWFNESGSPGTVFYLDNIAVSGGAGPQPPSIATQPVDQSIGDGQHATFTVAAIGTGPLSYQWSRNGTPIPGATARTYTTGAAAAGDDGSQFTVTVTNAVGAASSAPAVLHVAANLTVTYVYRAGTLGDGWSAYVWSGCGTGNPNLQTPYAGGVTAGFDLTCSTSGYDAGVFGYWSSPFDLSKYDTLSFDVGAIDPTNMGALKIWFDNGGVQVDVGVPAAGALQHVSVKLSALGLSSSTINQFGFFDASAIAGPKFVVDNVAFSGPASSAGAIPCKNDCSQVAFTVDVGLGPTDRASGPLPVSPFVYGINPASGDLDRSTRWGLFRAGGNSTSAWNWMNDYHNAGADYCYWQGLGNGSAPAGDLSWVPTAADKGIAALVTVPIGDYVSARLDNQTWPACNSVPVSTNVNSIPFAPSSYFVANRSTKGGAFCLYPGPNGETGSCAVDPAAGTVYQDEFAAYVKQWWVDGHGATVFFSLDNEPNYWAGTHPEIWSNPTVGYDEIVDRDRLYGSALKSVWPQAKIFGPVVAQDGIVFAHDYSRNDEFLDYYLPRMSGILDVLDVHYYNNSTDPATCLQNPRAFWDPAYTVPNNQDGMDYIPQYRLPDWAHRRIIPRLLDKIAAANMSPVPGLSFSEYDSGCEGDISGGVAQAEALGLFGKYGVYAGTAWFVGRNVGSDYAGVAFDAYRNYDGNGAAVGDVSVSAATTNDVDTSVYAFTHAGDPRRMELVLLNKTTSPIPGHVRITTSATFTAASVYHLVRSASVAVTPAGGTPPAIACDGASCTLDYVLEPLSVTTLVLR